MRGLHTYISKISNWVFYFLLTVVVLVISVSSYYFINYLKKEEVESMKLFANAQSYLHDDETKDPKVMELALNIIEENNTIPVIVTDRNKKIKLYRNIPKNIEENPERLKKLLHQMENTYPPVEVKMPNNKNDYIYYSNSKLLSYLVYYPFVISLFIILYIVFSYWFLKSVKKNFEGLLWAGLAKETAHQIGTPLSSIMGWLEIMKSKDVESAEIHEIEKDIKRLTNITDRFSKIGSKIELNDLNIKETVKQNYDYLLARSSNRVNFTLKLPQEDVLIPHSRVLIEWVMENLVVNAIDAMKGEGNIEISMHHENNKVDILVKDDGSGMTKSQMKKVFKHGYSTKKRGWGIGLSLAKRAIDEYHEGNIKIIYSELGKGTTFKISIKG